MDRLVILSKLSVPLASNADHFDLTLLSGPKKETSSAHSPEVIIGEGN